MKSLKKNFLKGKYFSSKHTNYFSIYEEVFKPYLPKRNIKIVEIGVFSGGSVELWSKCFHKSAIIYGLDKNPNLDALNSKKIKIEHVDQDNIKSLQKVAKEIGQIDILIDDGGHTNKQQINTFNVFLPYMKENGVMIFEDTHASFMKEFGNPSIFSFISYAKKIIDLIHSRSIHLPSQKNIITSKIYKIEFFESIVAFHISKKKSLKNEIINNHGKIVETAKDFRNTSRFELVNSFTQLISNPKIKLILKYVYYKLDNLKNYKNFQKLKK
jgi:hypothetical protein